MINNFKLGQKVVVTGRYEKVSTTPREVEEMQALVKRGCNVLSSKYELSRFEKAKHGIIVGKRSIGIKRRHYQEYGAVITDVIKWKPVYLIATDMRGLFYAPEEEIEGLGEDYLSNVIAEVND